MLVAIRAKTEQIVSKHPNIFSLFRGTALVMVTQVLGIGLTYAMQVLIARWAGPLQFGLFAYAWTCMNVIFLVAGFGLNELALRIIPVYVKQQNWGMLRGFIFRGPIIVTILAGLCGLIGVSVILLTDWVGEHYRLPLLLTFGATPLFGLLSFFQGVGRALGGVLTAFLPRYVGLPALVIIAVGTMIVTKVPPTATLILTLMVVSVCFVALVQGMLLIRSLPTESRHQFTKSKVRKWFRQSMPFLFIAACYGILTHCDLLMIGFFLQAEEVALYQAASRTAALISFPLFAVSALAAPMISKFHVENRLMEVQRTLSTATTLMFVPLLGAAVLAILASKYILGIFGPTFENGQSVFAILIIAHLINVAAGPVSYIMTMTGNQQKCAYVWATTVVGQVILNAIFIPRTGIIGAAIITTLSTAYLLGVLSILIKKQLHIRTHAFAFMPKI